jgi:putative hydrolase
MHFLNLKACPRKKYGIRLAFGVEANILDYKGNIDMPDDILEKMDLCIASIHPPCFHSGTVKQNTNAYLGVMKNPHVNIIGHPDDGRFPVDYDKLVHGAKENHVALELNNSSLKPGSFRPGARDNYKKMLSLCKELNVPIALGSDAHVEEDIADFTLAIQLLEELNFPEELVLNTSVEKLQKFIDEKKSTC